MGPANNAINVHLTIQLLGRHQHSLNISITWDQRITPPEFYLYRHEFRIHLPEGDFFSRKGEICKEFNPGSLLPMWSQIQCPLKGITNRPTERRDVQGNQYASELRPTKTNTVVPWYHVPINDLHK